MRNVAISSLKAKDQCSQISNAVKYVLHNDVMYLGEAHQG